MVRKLIVNADDFGISKGQNYAIVDCYKRGILTSTTLMINMLDSDHAIELWKQNQGLALGLHLCCTLGPSTLGKPNSFCDKSGNFYLRSHYPNKYVIVNKDELYNEWVAQIEKFKDKLGFYPEHLDSHHHIHIKDEYKDVILKIYDQYQIPFRQFDQITDAFRYVRCSEDFYNEGVSIESLEHILNFDDEYFELMCHPAFLDQTLIDSTSYLKRPLEHAIITSDEVQSLIKKYQVQLITYSQI